MLDHPASGSITLGVALAAAFLTRGWIGALPIMLAVPFIFMPCSVLWRQKKWLIATAAICVGLILLWWIPARSASDYWIHNWLLRSEEHTSELQSLMRISYAVFCWKKKKQTEN